MDAGKGNIFNLLNGLKQYLIPVYQRLYSWELSQCQRLWNDIVSMQKENREGHFLGSIVCIAEKTAPTGVQKYMVIDGQQRLTTLTLVLIALRDSVTEDSGININQLNTSFLTNQYENGDNKYKLLLTEEDRDVLIALIEKKPLKEGTQSKLLTAYNYFKTQIAKNEINPQLLFEATGKLQIVIITLERDHDDPQAIFESLNSTGKELSQSDLIRNYVLMGLDKDAQQNLYDNLWRIFEELFGHENQDDNMDSFFRDYLTMQMHRIPKISNVYEEFKAWKVNCKFSSNEDLCKDLYEYAVIYTDIIFARNSDAKLQSLFKEIQTLNYLLDRLENYDNKSPVIIENLTIEHIMPQNDHLNAEWIAELGPEWQRVHDVYLHTIGNLTLTGYNSEMSDKSFMEKMTMTGGFRETAVRLNTYVVAQTHWAEEQIQERAQILLKKALEIWAFPTLTEEELAPYKVEVVDNSLKYSLETYEPNPYTRMLFEKLDTRVMNLSSAVKKEFKKLYVAYKLETNFVDVVFQEKRLRISINMKFADVKDPKGICRDITGLGRWGNGDCELFLEDIVQLDDVMEIIQQSYDYQVN